MKRAVGRALPFLLLFALAGCGFRPLYGETSSTASGDLSRVRIAPIQDQPDLTGRNATVARAGQQLRNFLLTRVTPRGAPAAPQYELNVRLTEAKTVLGIRSDESATRANLSLSAGFNLTRIDNGELLLSSSARSETSYNILRNEFATLSAEKDARERGARELSEAISLQVANALGAQRAGAP